MSAPRLLLIDNFDSFTYNLAQAFMQLGAGPEVRRNDAIDLHEIEAGNFTHLVISPGPGRPEQACVSIDAIKICGGQIPILGVCLGHQAIAQVFGGAIIPALRPMHGKASYVHHDGVGLFEGLGSPFSAGRYHSLAVSRQNLPETLAISAHAEDAIMGLRHTTLAIDGVQFHPESFLTPQGGTLLANFLRQSGGMRETRVHAASKSPAP